VALLVSGEPDTVVTARDVSFAFQLDDGSTRPVLGSIDLQVRLGEIVTIVGPSGSGKTTLLRVLAGLIEPSRGEVRIGGRRASDPDCNIGVVFQNDRLMPWRTVAENVHFGLEVSRMDETARSERVRDALRLVGLRAAGRLYPHQLSGGMRQRVNLARALALRPAVLLMDEPFASLDAQSREFMQEELLKICSESGAAVVFVTHQIDEAVFLGDRIVVLSGQPCIVVEELQVPYASPRALEIKSEPVFNELVARVWRQVKSGALAHWERDLASTLTEGE
jgi:NitT/TauT family transport system ATP-binding protein